MGTANIRPITQRSVDNMNENKLLSIAVPAYNSAAFMHTCLDTLICAGSRVEVLVVNDGSKDNTLAVAKKYAANYPDIVVSIDQENRGWGGAINHAVQMARGEYFYIVDSDDWVDSEQLNHVLDRIENLECRGARVDMHVVNYIYNHVCDNTQHTIHCRKLIPREQIVEWDDLNLAKIDQYLMIHNMIYRTSIIRESGLELPEHMSYMDSLFMLRPLRYVKTLYYHDSDLYLYTIGREGQSIDVEVLKKHIDEQIFATREAIRTFDYDVLQDISPKLASCSLRYLSAMLTVSSIHLFQIGTPDAIAAHKDLWKYLKDVDEKLYRRLFASWAGLVNRRTPIGRGLAQLGYNLGAKLFKFA